MELLNNVEDFCTTNATLRLVYALWEDITTERFLHDERGDVLIFLLKCSVFFTRNRAMV